MQLVQMFSNKEFFLQTWLFLTVKLRWLALVGFWLTAVISRVSSCDRTFPFRHEAKKSGIISIMYKTV